jgi:hypothetical protein
VHRSSFSLQGRIRATVLLFFAFAGSEHFVQTEEAKEQKGDERDAEEKYIPPGPGRVGVHVTSSGPAGRPAPVQWMREFGDAHKGSTQRNETGTQERFNYLIEHGPVGLSSPSFVDLTWVCGDARLRFLFYAQ